MEIEEKKWVLVRTNNGEWISDIHIEIVDEDRFEILSFFAEGKDIILEKHYGYYDTGEKYIWCYRNDIDKILRRLKNKKGEYLGIRIEE